MTDPIREHAYEVAEKALREEWRRASSFPLVKLARIVVDALWNHTDDEGVRTFETAADAIQYLAEPGAVHALIEQKRALEAEVDRERALADELAEALMDELAWVGGRNDPRNQAVLAKWREARG